MNNMKIVLILFSCALIISCTNNTPSGVYEGEIFDELVVLDFTIDSTVIIKSLGSKTAYARKSLNMPMNFYKEKCSWKKVDEVIEIHSTPKKNKTELIYKLRFDGNDLVEVESGERLKKS